MPSAALAPTAATWCEKFINPPACSTWSAAKAKILPVARSTPIRVRNREAVPLDPRLELLVAIVREPDRVAGEEHRRQRDIERKRRMIASAETAAHIGELRVDARRFVRGVGFAEQEGDRFGGIVGRLHADHEFEVLARLDRTRQDRFPVRETSDPPIASRIAAPAPDGPGCPPQARRECLRRNRRLPHNLARSELAAAPRPGARVSSNTPGLTQPFLNWRIDIGRVRGRAGYPGKTKGRVGRPRDGAGLLADISRQSRRATRAAPDRRHRNPRRSEARSAGRDKAASCGAGRTSRRRKIREPACRCAQDLLR